jgi:hypothetical protein
MFNELNASSGSTLGHYRLHTKLSEAEGQSRAPATIAVLRFAD